MVFRLKVIQFWGFDENNPPQSFMLLGKKFALQQNRFFKYQMLFPLIATNSLQYSPLLILAMLFYTTCMANTLQLVTNKQVEETTFSHRVLIMDLIDNCQAKLCISTPTIGQTS